MNVKGWVGSNAPIFRPPSSNQQSANFPEGIR